MADQVPGKVRATEAGNNYFGPGVVEFLEREHHSPVNTVIATPADVARVTGSPSTQLEQLMVTSGVSAITVNLRAAADRVNAQDSRAYITTNGPPVQMIIVAENARSGAESFNSFAGLPSNAPNKAPGSVQDWRAMTLFHEKTHHDEGHARVGGVDSRQAAGQPTGIKDEYVADGGGTALYRRAQAAGVVKDPNVPDALRAARAIAAFTGAKAEYGVAGMRDSPGFEGLAQSGNHGLFAAGDVRDTLAQVRQAVYTEVLRTQNPAGYERMLAQAMYDDYKEKNPKGETPTAFLEAMKQADAGKPAALHELMSGAPVTPEVAERAQRYAFATVSASLSESASKQEASPYLPHLLNASIAVHNSGQFAANPGAQAAISTFVSAVQTYAPAAFAAPTAQLAAPQVSVPTMPLPEAPPPANTPEPVAATPGAPATAPPPSAQKPRPVAMGSPG